MSTGPFRVPERCIALLQSQDRCLGWTGFPRPKQAKLPVSEPRRRPGNATPPQPTETVARSHRLRSVERSPRPRSCGSAAAVGLGWAPTVVALLRKNRAKRWE